MGVTWLEHKLAKLLVVLCGGNARGTGRHRQDTFVAAADQVEMQNTISSSGRAIDSGPESQTCTKRMIAMVFRCGPPLYPHFMI